MKHCQFFTMPILTKEKGGNQNFSDEEKGILQSLDVQLSVFLTDKNKENSTY